MKLFLRIQATGDVGDLSTAISRKLDESTRGVQLRRKIFIFPARNIELRRERVVKKRARGNDRQRKIGQSVSRVHTPAEEKELLAELRCCILLLFSDQSSEMR